MKPTFGPMGGWCVGGSETVLYWVSIVAPRHAFVRLVVVVCTWALVDFRCDLYTELVLLDRTRLPALPEMASMDSYDVLVLASQPLAILKI